MGWLTKQTERRACAITPRVDRAGRPYQFPVVETHLVRQTAVSGLAAGLRAGALLVSVKIGFPVEIVAFYIE